MTEGITSRSLRIASLLVAAIVVLLGFDGTLHWDEPGYLYAGIYQTVDQILRAEVQPSGIPDFTTGKLLHVLFVHLVYSLVGSSTATALLVAGLYTLMLASSLWVTSRITARLLSAGSAAASAGTLAVALTPVVAYLAFKTLADIPAFFLGCVTTYAILRSATRASAAWIGIGIISLAMAAMTKTPAVILPASFVAAALLFPVASLDRRRTFLTGLAVGLAAGAVTLLVLSALSISLDRFLGSSDLLSKHSPLVPKLMHIAITAGVVWVLLPFSLLTTRRPELRFFWAWFAVATLPFLLLFEHVEPRYLPASLVPMAGIAALAIEAAWSRARPLFNRQRPLALAAASVSAVLLVTAHALAMKVMPHEVDVFELRKSLAGLDAIHGNNRSVILASSRFTDFHILRVLWPERAVYCVDDTPLLVTPRSENSAAVLSETYMQGRQIESLDGLHQLDGPFVYFGFEQTFAPVNLAAIMDLARPGLGARLLASFDLLNHLEMSWVWTSDQLLLEPISTSAHYRVFDVQLKMPAGQPAERAVTGAVPPVT